MFTILFWSLVITCTVVSVFLWKTQTKLTDLHRELAEANDPWVKQVRDDLRRGLAEANDTWGKKVADLHRELAEVNEAWEKGLNDQEEIYEMQLLTADEKIEAQSLLLDGLREEAAALTVIVAQHEAFCLPSLDPRL